jgi:membrane-bound ClpP family serine protease
MKSGFSIVLWKIAVALYLFANGVLGLQKKTWSNFFEQSDFQGILSRIGFKGDTLSTFVAILSVIAIVAGAILILELFKVRIPILDTLIIIIAIVWAVFIVVELFGWFKNDFDHFYKSIAVISVHVMILSSILYASKRFA